MSVLNKLFQTGALLAGLGFALSSNAGVIYSNDFSSDTAGLTGAVDVATAANGEKFIGFLNGGETVNLSLSGLAAHTTVTLDFDVIGLRSLDGTTNQDNFVLEVNGVQVFQDFYGHTGNRNAGVIIGPTTGMLVSHETPSEWFGQFYGGASIYHYSLTFVDSAAAISFDFIANANQGWSDEAFGLDNIVVSAVPEPSSIALIALGLLGFGASRRRARR